MTFDKDCLEGTKLVEVIEQNAVALPDEALRGCVLEYLLEYQMVYDNELMNLPNAYLKARLLDGEEPRKLERKLAEHKLLQARGEYFISLNEVAEATFRLFNSEPLTLGCIQACINHVLVAHACNEAAEAFLPRELQKLEAKFSRYLNNHKWCNEIEKVKVVHQGRGGYVEYDGKRYSIEMADGGHFYVGRGSGRKGKKRQRHLEVLQAFIDSKRPKSPYVRIVVASLNLEIGDGLGIEIATLFTRA